MSCKMKADETDDLWPTMPAPEMRRARWSWRDVPDPNGTRQRPSVPGQEDKDNVTEKRDETQPRETKDRRKDIE